LLGGAAAWPSIALAQQTRVGLPLIGALWPGKPSAPITGSLLQAFREGLREVGFVEGQNVTTEHRYAEGPVGLEKAANDLAGLNVKVILAVGTPAVLAARRATTTIPIVGASMADPVADGSVASLARPGGNVTGNTFLGPELMPQASAVATRDRSSR
jgi:putative tryptophan/tyrosine transport system substrate-binding protein